jgi:hypothetical protein
VSKIRKSIPSPSRRIMRDQFAGVLPVNTSQSRPGRSSRAGASGFGAVFEIAVHGALARIEIDRGDPRALIGQRHATWTAVVDLPVPPFSLAKTMRCGPGLRLARLIGRAFSGSRDGRLGHQPLAGLRR